MRRLVGLVALLSLVVWACGGEAKAPVAPALDLDSDPVRLLPGSAVVAANLDAKALFASPGLGPGVASLADSLVPLGPDAGFDARRDVDRVLLGAYTSTGADVSAVVSGRFDAAKIDAATASRGGTPIVHGMYAGRATYAVGAVMLSVLSGRTVVAGTPDGVRRVLERIQDGKLERSVPAWMLETLATPGAPVALVADFTTQPVASAAIGSISLPWLDGLHVAKVIGNFEDPGMNVAATLTYVDETHASSAADGIRSADRWLRVLGPLIGVVAPKDLTVKAEASDVKCKLALDDAALRRLLELVPRLLGAPR
ncbi:MAG TPA: hypothetical protein VIF09_20820 [Polyangiaceae bacterium]|jgi:hypothetical protein